jgi:hypothetical protein
MNSEPAPSLPQVEDVNVPSLTSSVTCISNSGQLMSGLNACVLRECSRTGIEASKSLSLG